MDDIKGFERERMGLNSSSESADESDEVVAVQGATIQSLKKKVAITKPVIFPFQDSEFSGVLKFIKEGDSYTFAGKLLKYDTPSIHIRTTYMKDDFVMNRTVFLAFMQALDNPIVRKQISEWVSAAQS